MLCVFFWGRVPLNVDDGTVCRAVICSSHRLSIQTTAVSGTVWPQFAMQVLNRGCQPQFGEKGVVGPENWSLSSPAVTSSTPHSNHRPVSHRFRSALTCHGQTQRRTDDKKRQFYRPPNSRTSHCYSPSYIQRATIGLCFSEFFCIFFLMQT